MRFQVLLQRDGVPDFVNVYTLFPPRQYSRWERFRTRCGLVCTAWQRGNAHRRSCRPLRPLADRALKGTDPVSGQTPEARDNPYSDGLISRVIPK
jgi:hypothetical protein